MSTEHHSSAAEPGAAPEEAPRLVFIDSIEENVARLVRTRQGEAQAFSFPADLLPAGATEGKWLELQMRVVPPPPGEDPGDLRKRLVGGDDGGDISL